MRESMGEANITLITILLIGFIILTGMVLVPRLLKNVSKKSCCTENGGTFFQNKCYDSNTCTTEEATGKINNCEIIISAECK